MRPQHPGDARRQIARPSQIEIVVQHAHPVQRRTLPSHGRGDSARMGAQETGRHARDAGLWRAHARFSRRPHPCHRPAPSLQLHQSDDPARLAGKHHHADVERRIHPAADVPAHHAPGPARAADPRGATRRLCTVCPQPVPCHRAPRPPRPRPWCPDRAGTPRALQVVAQLTPEGTFRWSSGRPLSCVAGATDATRPTDAHGPASERAPPHAFERPPARCRSAPPPVQRSIRQRHLRRASDIPVVRLLAPAPCRLSPRPRAPSTQGQVVRDAQHALRAGSAAPARRERAAHACAAAGGDQLLHRPARVQVICNPLCRAPRAIRVHTVPPSPRHVNARVWGEDVRAAPRTFPDARALTHSGRDVPREPRARAREAAVALQTYALGQEKRLSAARVNFPPLSSTIISRACAGRSYIFVQSRRLFAATLLHPSRLPLWLHTLPTTLPPVIYLLRVLVSSFFLWVFSIVLVLLAVVSNGYCYLSLST
ncbi:hypothetical protein DFH07DRAFT_13274 [Mycena maculata]|uniref:Uncharacterized protein n=1 Tax=Mycena maculata TaxID=230809 RepID=A0AAD7N537_9AGAR|nr:hypothetical protein DFH07DRAFT_13274 [Mycena maculata]